MWEFSFSQNFSIAIYFLLMYAMSPCREITSTNLPSSSFFHGIRFLQMLRYHLLNENKQCILCICHCLTSHTIFVLPSTQKFWCITVKGTTFWCSRHCHPLKVSINSPSTVDDSSNDFLWNPLVILYCSSTSTGYSN